MSSRMRITSGKTRSRRSHHGLKSPRLSRCSECGSSHLRHRMCDNCGFYKGKKIIDMTSVIVKKQERKEAKLKSLGLDPKKKEETAKDEKLDLKKLSSKKKK